METGTRLEEDSHWMAAGNRREGESRLRVGVETRQGEAENHREGVETRPRVGVHRTVAG